MLQNAKRMVLVDEKLFDSNPALQHFQSKQDLSWKQPTEETVRTSISKGLKTTLDDPNVPDDVKVKQYGRDLNRFLHTKSKLPDSDIHPSVDELLEGEGPRPPPLPPPPPPQAAPLRKKLKKKIRKTSKLQKERTSWRAKKKPQRYSDIDWERW